MHRSPRTPHRLLGSALRLLSAFMVILLLTAPVLKAQDSNVPEDPPEPKPAKKLRFNWDTTLEYSTAFRVSGRSSRLVDLASNPTNLDQDDGDRNFHGGLISNRTDVLSEMDVVYGDFGVRGSMAAWGDAKYNQRTADKSPQTYNSLSTDYQHFPAGTKDLHFLYGELLDAFAFGKVDVGSQSKLTFRGGQYAQLWGESLFFGNNGIAGGMSPIDVLKLLAEPNAQFKEIIRPVPQVSAELQINPKLSVGAFYQLMWKKTRLPGVGSYFSTLDFLDEGGERILWAPPIVPGGGPAAFFRGRDLEAKDSGQFGVQLKAQAGHRFGLGFYAVQFHDKVPQLYIRPSVVFTPTGPVVLDPTTFNPQTGEIGTYYLAYHENVRAYGVSATKTTGYINWAVEISGRTNMDLVSDAQVFAPLPGAVPPDNKDRPLYAVGDSLHANLSALATVPPNFISREATFLGEVAWNRLLGITHNGAALDPNTTRDAVGFRLTYEPFYRQVRPGIDLSFPFGFGFFPMGRSAVLQSFGPNRGGDFNIGMTAAYHDAWRFGISYNHFYGTPASVLDAKQHYQFGQPLADRNYFSVSIRHTFGVSKKG
jgi:hypothetical protein